ncbi:MAG: exodeoxyribonuclease VII large subunit [Deltaproteobacteria bacterium]|nr:exodeoxyribonuclease VII large subunit [Deltaproteobacteria bacterium]
MLLETALAWVWVEGEIGNLRTAASGHAYFTLGDRRGQVRAVCFRSVLRLLAFRPADGERVLARGRLTVYEERGDLQLVVEDCEPIGSGLQRLELERRKRRLAAEGLFREERKRPLPELPRAIGVVTSSAGAALGDILKVLGRRAPGVSVYLAPARVQGRSAPQELKEALALAAGFPPVDVVILGRGGGSSEDLSAFDDEGLVRAIASCPVPVISAVGHEMDVTLSDLAADARAPTPSAAAEMAVREWGHWVGRVSRAEAALSAALARRLERSRRRLERAEAALRSPAGLVARFRLTVDRRLEACAACVGPKIRRALARTAELERRTAVHDPARRLARVARRLADAEARLSRSPEILFHARRSGLASLEARLSALNPLGVLARGYSLVTRDGRVVRDAAACAPGDALNVRLARGELECLVSLVRPAPDPLRG